MTEDEFLEIYTGILHRHLTPIVEIDASYGQVFVPRELVEDDGVIVLNLSPKAVRSLKVQNDTVYCRASFRAQVISISFPLENIKTIYPQENDA